MKPLSATCGGAKEVVDEAVCFIKLLYCIAFMATCPGIFRDDFQYRNRVPNHVGGTELYALDARRRVLLVALFHL